MRQDGNGTSAENSRQLLSAHRIVVEVQQHPIPSVSLPQVVKEEQPYLEPEQVQAFVDAVKGQSCEIPALLFLHSLRRSELCALSWGKIDLTKKRILVSGAKVYDKDNKLVAKKENKNTSSRRYVPILIDALYDALNAVDDKTGAIVKVHPNTLWEQINRVCESAGLPLVGTKGLRHSFASLCYHLKVPELIAMQIGGWSDYNTMRKIYTHLAQKDVEKYGDELRNFFNKANRIVNETA